MVAVGFESDLKVPGLENSPFEVHGTIQEHSEMWENFVRIFEEEGTDNVVWVMDYSAAIKKNWQLAVDLWPSDDVVQWLFFNLF